MNLKKSRIISSIGIFILCFLFHFIYEIMPNGLTAIFFPVNESLWEHMKLIFTSVIFYGIIDYIILSKFKIEYNNFFITLFITAITIIPIFLGLYLPFYFKIGPKMFLNIIVMGIAIIISQVISYFLLKCKYNKTGNIVCLILIIASYIIFGYLTYNPPKTRLFFDVEEEKYGINNYNM